MSRACLLSCLLVAGLAAGCSSGTSGSSGTGSGTTGGSTGATTGAACTVRCPGKNQACVINDAGAQTCGCKSGFSNCPASGSNQVNCVNEKTDDTNCGSCGNACSAPLGCSAGSCQCVLSSTIASCPDGDGGHVCADLTTDPNHCGGCKNICGPDATCVYDSDAGPPAACVCTNELLNACTGVCVDITTDPDNCGACGNVCMPPDAGGPPTQCLADNGGTCDCQAPWLQCTLPGPCLNSDTDINNCGQCGMVCFANGGPVTCDAGNCFCGPDGTGTICPDGSCPDMLTDVDHCGNCNVHCEAVDAGVACQDGHCFCGADSSGIICPSGLCSKLVDDPRNCGTCGTECFVPTPYCVDGGCASAPSG